MNNIAVRIINCGPKWTHIRYVSSNAKSRISTKKLIEDMRKNAIDVVNENALESVM
jgi:hypothetical protein